MTGNHPLEPGSVAAMMGQRATVAEEAMILRDMGRHYAIDRTSTAPRPWLLGEES